MSSLQSKKHINQYSGKSKAGNSCRGRAQLALYRHRRHYLGTEVGYANAEGFRIAASVVDGVEPYHMQDAQRGEREEERPVQAVVLRLLENAIPLPRSEPLAA
jgi:hypothetical protein